MSGGELGVASFPGTGPVDAGRGRGVQLTDTDCSVRDRRGFLPSSFPLGLSTVALSSLVCLVVALSPSSAQGRKVEWRKAGASVYGGACEYGATGYKGDHLPSHPRSYAELGMGTILGLPYKQRVRFLLRGRKVTGVKRDIGGFNPPVMGFTRTFDFYEPLLTRLLGHRDCNWTGVVSWRRVK